MMQSLAVSLRSSPSFHRFSPPLDPQGTAISGRSRTSPTSLSFRIRSPLRCVLQSPSLVADKAEFLEASKKGNLVPLHRCLFADHLTPVLAYRCLVNEDDREVPSFLFESVEPGFLSSQVGRYSVVGSEPSIEVMAKENNVTIVDHTKGSLIEKVIDDPLEIPKGLSDGWKPQLLDGLPDTFCGGWVGYFSYDTVRYVEKKKLLFIDAPVDDRNLPDLHLGLYEDVIVFDHVQKKAYVIHWVRLDQYSSIEEAYEDGIKRLEILVSRVHDVDAPRLSPGSVELSTHQFGTPLDQSSMTSEEYMAAVMQAKEHILAGDIFQIVLSQRFERRTFADPFEIYRALRNMVVNRPLAGTVRRGRTADEDKELEHQLLNDEKQCAEHIMLVDLGRNDVGKVSKSGSVNVEKLMTVERYSHVMHISSTVTGELRDDLTCWDALRSALPVGTVTTRRGPYSGGFGWISFSGEMDIALSLRTMVFPTGARFDTMYLYKEDTKRKQWVAHLQAGAGIVADSVPEDEQQECQNKAAGLARAIDLAESAFCK
ncbi:ADC synthase [Cynara cardunculus var. scolymus]|uniref:ADC synthase n=1 Tax=Cynara cardunculus var. scolymus TaxID=59895 RepID=A0A103Y9C9_CYNCS|nr:ADC synthase [Cynara cardunculus var. scolymus]